ncbi:MAG: hypothetical protein ABIG20_05200 [archaeon]
MKLTMELKTMLIHIVMGIIIGYVSNMLTSNIVILFMMIVVLFATGQAVQKAFSLKPETSASGEKKYDRKWWLSNGAYPYIVFWIFIWILFYNL